MPGKRDSLIDRLQLDGQSLHPAVSSRRGERHPERPGRRDSSASRRTDRLQSAIAPQTPDWSRADVRRDRPACAGSRRRNPARPLAQPDVVVGQEMTKQTLSVSSFSSTADKGCVVPVRFKPHPDQVNINGSELVDRHSRLLCRAILHAAGEVHAFAHAVRDCTPSASRCLQDLVGPCDHAKSPFITTQVRMVLLRLRTKGLVDFVQVAQGPTPSTVRGSSENE